MTHLEKRLENIEDTLTRLFDTFLLHDEGINQQLYDDISEIGNDFDAAKNYEKRDDTEE